MKSKKVLILYTSIGLGHKSIAENIAFFLQRAGYEVGLYDAHKVEDGWLARGGTKLYLFFISRLPFIWDWLYNTDWFISATLPFRTVLASFNYKNTLDIINRLQPDIIISTHNTASAIVSCIKQKNLYRGAFGIAFSDFHLHRFWLFGNADFYLANIEEQKTEMVELGIPAAKIFVCGITLKPKMQVDEAVVRNKLGIAPDERVILLASGSQGTGVDENLIGLFYNKPQIKVIVTCGKNKKLADTLNTKFSGGNAIILNYYSPMDELYSVADIFISKPGGLSIAEALAWNLPIVVSHLLPGGEVRNYEYLLKKGMIMNRQNSIGQAAAAELQTRSFKNSLISNPNLPKILGGGQDVIGAIEAL